MILTLPGTPAGSRTAILAIEQDRSLTFEVFDANSDFATRLPGGAARLQLAYYVEGATELELQLGSMSSVEPTHMNAHVLPNPAVVFEADLSVEVPRWASILTSSFNELWVPGTRPRRIMRLKVRRIEDVIALVEGLTCCDETEPIGGACARSNRAGELALPGVLAGMPALVRCHRGDLFPMALMLPPGESTLETLVGTLELATARSWAEKLDVAIDPAGSHVLFGVTLGSGLIDLLSGTEVRAVVPSGTAFMLDAFHEPTTELTATGTTGLGGIFNVDPGELELEFVHPRFTCTRQDWIPGWPGETPNRVRLVLSSGELSFVGMACR